MQELTGKQRRYLRGLGNTLKASVYLGREGISKALITSLEQAFSTRELVKVRVERNCPLDRREAGDKLAAAAGVHLVQVLGQTVLLYRPDPEKPEIHLPA